MVAAAVSAAVAALDAAAALLALLGAGELAAEEFFACLRMQNETNSKKSGLALPFLRLGRGSQSSAHYHR